MKKLLNFVLPCSMLMPIFEEKFRNMDLGKEYFSTVGFMLCTRGSLQARVFGKELTLGAGMLCFFSPIIAVSIVSQSHDCEVARCDVPVTSVFPLLSKVVPYLQHLDIDTKPYVQLSDSQQQAILAQCRELAGERSALESSTTPLMRILAEQNVHILEQRLMMSALRIFAGRQDMGDVETANVTRKVAFRFMLLLSVHFRKHRTVEYYAASLGMSASYFTRMFKRQTGSTPMEIIHTITCTASRHLLEKSDLSVKEIAAELGFPEQFTFRKYFKKHAGMSPTEYRRKVGEGSTFV